MNKATRTGFIIFAVLVLAIIVLCLLPAFVWLPQAGRGVPLPPISVKPEIIGHIFGQPLTNTLTSVLLVDVCVLLMGFVVWRAFAGKKPEETVPRGFTNFLELITEFLYNQAKPLLGERLIWAFPLSMSIFLFLLVGNYIKLVPGVETVGVMACAETGQAGYGLSGYQDGVPGTVLDVGGLTLPARAGHKVTDDDVAKCESEHNGEFTAPGAPDEKAAAIAAGKPKKDGDPTKGDPNSQYYNVVGYFRGMATDLNLPLALAIIVVIMVQVWGVRALGPAYFFKFINIPALGNIANNPIGGMDFVVGLVEIISELSRLVSLSFRLFGNIFAGGVLLIVMSFLAGGLLPIPFYFLELFAGLIQAYVFATLVIIYTSQAVTSHHEEEHEAEHETHGHEVPVTSAQLP